jgi:hypothetical protein
MVLLPRSTPAIRKNKPSPKLRNNSAALVLQVVLNRSCPNPRPIRANLCLLRPPFHARDQSSAPLDRADAGRRPEGLVDSLDASAFCGQDAAIHICGEMHTDGLPSGVRGRPRERSSLLQPPQRSNGVWLRVAFRRESDRRENFFLAACWSAYRNFCRNTRPKNDQVRSNSNIALYAPGFLYYINYLFEDILISLTQTRHSLGQFGFKTNSWSFTN